MATVNDLMNAIAQMEGYNVNGTIAQRNNNPGNLRYASTQIGSESTVNGTFASFDSAQSGWDALQSYIQNAASSGVTLRQFINTYAPPSENDTTNYLNYLVSKLGVSADTPLSEITGGDSGQTYSADVSGSDFSNGTSILDNLLQSGTSDTAVIAVIGIGLLVGSLLSR